MRWREITIAGYAILALAVVAFQVASRSTDSRIPTMSATLGRAMATRSGRVAILAGWAWLGLHFFAL
jgi:Family of unknown function (DUF6186)